MAESFNSNEAPVVANGNNEITKSPLPWNPSLMSTPFVSSKDPLFSSSTSFSAKLFSKKVGFPAIGSMPSWKSATKAFGKAGDNFGTPSYPSPLDRIRKQERAAQFGLTPDKKEAFEGNQSLPPNLDDNDKHKLQQAAVPTILSSMKPLQLLSVSGQGLHSFSYSPGCSRGAFSPSYVSASYGDCSSDSWVYYNFVGGGGANNAVFPTSVQNPNKAVLTVDAASREILVVNKMACQIFGCSSSGIIGRKLDEFLVQEHRTQMLDEAEVDEDTGEIFPISGKVVDVRDVEGGIVPVSLWVKKLGNDDQSQRSLVVLEPVQRTTANIVFDETGKIMSADSNLSSLLGYSTPSDIIGSKICSHIPSLVVPNNCHQKKRISKALVKQSVTGRTSDGTTFPLSIRLSLTSAEVGSSSLNGSYAEESFTGSLFHGLVWVFSCISGIITIAADGTIQSCNSHFSALLFGFVEPELVGKSISSLIPNFFDDADFLDTDSMPLPPFEGDEDDRSLSGLCDSRNSNFSPIVSPSRPPNPTMHDMDDALDHLAKLDLNAPPSRADSFDIFKSNESLLDYSGRNSADVKILTESSNIEYVNNNYPNATQIRSELDSNTSPKVHRKSPSIPEGSYFGVGVHHDGADISILYQVKKVVLENGRIIYCLWISRDPEEAAEGGRTNCSLTLASSFSSTALDASQSSLLSLNDQPHSAFSPNVDQPDGACISACKSGLEPNDSVYTSGPYSRSYTTLRQIGKGAFGCVKMAYRNTDKLLVITKFIKKSKVYKDCWITDQQTKKKVPLEIKLLSTLSHPNVVKVLDVFENDKYYQMVMEKHGSGMDLFEFIDRGPRLDDKLTSYIFRQVVEGVAYLHSLNIVHRDIKDENIILDEYFNVKLIDFGSASLITENHLFSTFCGTMEYCSPEVLLGNRYRGPEQEVWALGITLFTLVFGENPFYDADETIAAKIRWPFQVEQDLKDIISSLLSPDINARLTMKDLKNNRWLHQEINVKNYTLVDVIHASKEEMNPSKYFIRESADLTDSFVQNINKMQLIDDTDTVDNDTKLLIQKSSFDTGHAT